MNIQATTDLVQYVRDVTMNQPYLVLLTRRDGGGAAEEVPPPEPSAVRAPVPEAGPMPSLGPP